MVFNCKGFYFDKEDEACGENSAEKRAVELPANEKSKKPRGSGGNGKRVVLVANADPLSRHQTEYDGDGQSKRTSKSISELGGANSKNSSRRSRVAPEESFEEQNPQHFQQLHPQPPKGSHQSDDDKKPKGKHGLDLMEPHQKIENSGNQKTQKEHSNRLLLRIRMHCNCEGCTKKMKGIFKGFKGVGSVNIHTDKDLVGVTGTMDTDKLVIYLEGQLRRNVKVMPIQNNENGACPTQKHGAGVRHIANITDNDSRKTGVYPNVQEKQNLEKTKLTLPQPRKGDRNDNEVTVMVHLKIRMYCLEGCIPQTQKTAREFTGVRSVKVDASKHLVIVVGTINVKELVAYLKEKLKRNVEVVHIQNDSQPRDNKEVEVTKIETLKEPAAAREDVWHNDVEIKKEVKKKDVEIKNKQNEGVEDNLKEAKEHGHISHDGEKHKELAREGDRQTYFQNYGTQDDLRYGPSNSDYVNQRENHWSLQHPVTHWNDEELHDQNYGMEAYRGYMNQGASYQRFNQPYAPDIFSDENPNACSIM